MPRYPDNPQAIRALIRESRLVKARPAGDCRTDRYFRMMTVDDRLLARDFRQVS